MNNCSALSWQKEDNVGERRPLLPPQRPAKPCGMSRHGRSPALTHQRSGLKTRAGVKGQRQLAAARPALKRGRVLLAACAYWHKAHCSRHCCGQAP